MSLSKHDPSLQPMIGQVGGLGLNRKPLLTLVPDYVLKPLVLDHRGLREIAFYEAIRTVFSQSQSQQEMQYNYNNFLTGRDPQQQPQQQISPKSMLMPEATVSNKYLFSFKELMSSIRNTILSILTPILKSIDTTAMAFALTYIQDPYVVESEKLLHEAWQKMQNEIDMMRQLNKFTPPYYGVIVIATPPLPSVLTAAPETSEATTSTTSLAPTEAGNTQPSRTVDVTVPPIIAEPTAVNTSVLIMESNNCWKMLEDAHLLLQNLTINYSKPCVMDLKMGVQTYVRLYHITRAHAVHG
jgi:hypothetical protein